MITHNSRRSFLGFLGALLLPKPKLLLKPPKTWVLPFKIPGSRIGLAHLSTAYCNKKHLDLLVKKFKFREGK